MALLSHTLLQAADRILLICETRQAVNPALRMPAATSSEQGEAEAAAGARPDLALQHVKLPQQYIEAAYPLVRGAVLPVPRACTAVLLPGCTSMHCAWLTPSFHSPSAFPFPLSPAAFLLLPHPQLHSAISQDGADVAVAGTRGLAVYSRRARRWRLFGDATQERSLRVGAAALSLCNRLPVHWLACVGPPPCPPCICMAAASHPNAARCLLPWLRSLLTGCAAFYLPQVESLVWLPGGIIAACAHVDTKEAAGAPQLLLYPQYHLDNASLLARMPLKQVSAALCLLWLAASMRCCQLS
jgi:hypothetical protein